MCNTYSASCQGLTTMCRRGKVYLVHQAGVDVCVVAAAASCSSRTEGLCSEITSRSPRQPADSWSSAETEPEFSLLPQHSFAISALWELVATSFIDQISSLL